MHVIPPKLQKRDNIRIIAPARSLSMIGEQQIQYSTIKLEEIGLNVSLSENVYESDHFISSSVKSRISDIHSAFEDQTVKAILTRARVWYRWPLIDSAIGAKEGRDL